MLDQARSDETWDVLVIGGGATGLGVALDSSLRGYRTILIDGGDFAHGTSSRSTKLIHGGVRYLARGEIGLVREALHERGLLLRNAPHLVRPLSFVIPAYRAWTKPYYGLGLWLYDRLAGRNRLAPSQTVGRDEALSLAPTLQRRNLRGGVVYEDAQFDDARLALCLARATARAGGVVLNYVSAMGLIHEGGRVRGARVLDWESGQEWAIRASVVVNAAGVYADSVRRFDDPGCPPILRTSQGAHLVFPREVLPGNSAVLVPRTDDGRVLFAIPWLDRVLVGTTDSPVDGAVDEPRPMDEEVDYLLEHAARYLDAPMSRSNVLAQFAGLRPLLAKGAGGSTQGLSREHAILVSPAGLVTVVGGKWTTYRRMAEQTVDRAANVAGLPLRPCSTETHSLVDDEGDCLDLIIREHPELSEPVVPGFPNILSEVVRAARFEMARTVEDVLARRMRLLVLDAWASAEAAPTVARLLARELGKDEGWVDEQVISYRSLAARCLPTRRE